jgi:hypothetical protein
VKGHTQKKNAKTCSWSERNCWNIPSLLVGEFPHRPRQMTAAPGSASPPRTARSAAAVTSKPFANSPRLNVLSNKRRGPAYSLAGRTEIKTDNLGPGPGECRRDESRCPFPPQPYTIQTPARASTQARPNVHTRSAQQRPKERNLKVRACWQDRRLLAERGYVAQGTCLFDDGTHGAEGFGLCAGPWRLQSRRKASEADSHHDDVAKFPEECECRRPRPRCTAPE